MLSALSHVIPNTLSTTVINLGRFQVNFSKEIVLRQGKIKCIRAKWHKRCDLCASVVVHSRHQNIFEYFILFSAFKIYPFDPTTFPFLFFSQLNFDDQPDLQQPPHVSRSQLGVESPASSIFDSATTRTPSEPNASFNFMYTLWRISVNSRPFVSRPNTGRGMLRSAPRGHKTSDYSYANTVINPRWTRPSNCAFQRYPWLSLWFPCLIVTLPTTPNLDFSHARFSHFAGFVLVPSSSVAAVFFNWCDPHPARRFCLPLFSPIDLRIVASSRCNILGWTCASCWISRPLKST